MTNMSDYHVQKKGADAAAKALVWAPRHPEALLRQGIALAETDPQQAEIVLRAAAEENPANGRVYLALARLREGQGEDGRAAKLVATATHLAPMRGAVQLGAAELWFKQGQWDQGIESLSMALELRPQLRERLYPVFLRLAEDPQTRLGFATLLRNPPSWWESFFAFTAKHAVDTSVAGAFYQTRFQQGQKPTAEERRHLLNRLEKDGRFHEAYFVWPNSLDAEQLDALGNVYNGGFELPLSDEGFGWRIPKIRGAWLESMPTYGAKGERALHVTFQGQRVRFRHLYQYLLLEPGDYHFRGRVWPDSLQTSQGVRWVVRCMPDSGEILGTSERFLGSTPWRQFVTQFTVPAEDCRVQELRLELVGRYAQEFEASGAIWFDALGITRLR